MSISWPEIIIGWPAVVGRGHRLLTASVLAPFLVTVMWLAYVVLTR